MGSLMTYFYYGKNEPDPVTGLRPKEIDLVKSTWNLCKKDLTGTGLQLFLLFFKDYPEYQSYFPFKEVPYEELNDNKQLKAHAVSVVYGFSSIVDNIDTIDVLLPVLHKISENHSKRKIPEKAFWDLEATILKLLEQGLGSRFTKDCKGAWKKTLDVGFKVIVDRLKELSN